MPWLRRSSPPSHRSTIRGSYASPDVVPAVVEAGPPGRPGRASSRKVARLGFQGPDQGFALKIASGFRDRLQLRPGEHVADAIQGCLGIALRRASIFSRAPVVHDLTIAFTIWGFLDGNPPAELLALRLRLFEGVGNTVHHYDEAAVWSTWCRRPRCG